MLVRAHSADGRWADGLMWVGRCVGQIVLLVRIDPGHYMCAETLQDSRGPSACILATQGTLLYDINHCHVVILSDCEAHLQVNGLNGLHSECMVSKPLGETRNSILDGYSTRNLSNCITRVRYITTHRLKNYDWRWCVFFRLRNPVSPLFVCIAVPPLEYVASTETGVGD